MNKENPAPVISMGPDKGRIADIGLAEGMAYAEKPHRDYFLSGDLQRHLEQVADSLLPEVQLEFPGKSQEELGKIALKIATDFEGIDIDADAERASKRVLHAHYRERVEDQRAKNYKRPVSAGLPSLGKRR